ncbi:nucleotidyltransferase domain-containing protein [Opitutales bacterium ASA1]|uniref:nucleotidyltransferase family protein n=1 Tax=Congregicoccus parvus TaxID=3081749 RepID=UPI002B2B634D|nr:nucleotidyltransferase domain-containing protein [Opitutales bacterium ASA1]
MPRFLEQHRDAIVEICRRFGVRQLSVFGSVLRNDFGPDSDVDFLVDFDRNSEFDAFSQYFGLKEALEATLGREVDLVSIHAIRSPVFRDEVERTRSSLYVAA